MTVCRLNYINLFQQPILHSRLHLVGCPTSLFSHWDLCIDHLYFITNRIERSSAARREAGGVAGAGGQDVAGAGGQEGAGGVAGAGGQERAGAGFQEHLEEEDERHQHSLKGFEGSLVAAQYGGQRLKIAARIRIGSEIGSILCSQITIILPLLPSNISSGTPQSR